MKTINNPDNPVVLFIPEAGIYPFMRGLAVLGDAIAKQGGKIFVTHDTGVMLRSPLMVKNRMPVNASLEQKAKICKKNTRILKKVLSKYNFSLIDLSNFVDDKLINEISNLTKGKENDLESITYKGFPVGEIAQYDFILETKFPYSPNLSKDHKLLYSTYVENTALTIAITNNICRKYKPSLFLTFNEYAQGQGVRFSAQNHRTKRMALTYPVHLNIDGSRFSVWEQTYENWRYTHCQNWDKIKNIPVETKFLKEYWKDILFRLNNTGSHIFSSKKTENPVYIFKKLGLNPNKKIIVVYTSSQDERGSVEAAMKIWKEGPQIIDAFPSQIEWLSTLQDYAAKKDNVQIIVRIHPREGRRQFGFDSHHLTQLKNKFRSEDKNFKIIWPDDPISSYDLMELADACLIAWSFMGQEASRLGIPVLSYTGNMLYPNDDFIQIASTPEEYIKRLDLILEMKYTWQHLLKAARFYNWRIFIPSLNLGETVPADFNDDNIWPEAPKSMVPVINDILLGKQDLIEYNIKEWQSSLNENSTDEESEAMRQGIRYFIDKIFYPPTSKHNGYLTVFKNRIFNKAKRIWHQISWNRRFPTKNKGYQFVDYNLEYSTNISSIDKFIEQTKQDKNLRVIIAEGHHSNLVHKGQVIKRMSPMCNNLARLHHESENK